MKVYQMDSEALKKNRNDNIILISVLAVILMFLMYKSITDTTSNFSVALIVWFFMSIFLIFLLSINSKNKIEISDNTLRVFRKNKLRFEFDLNTVTIRLRSTSTSTKSVKSLYIYKNGKEYVFNSNLIGENAFNELLEDLSPFLPKNKVVDFTKQ